MKFSFYEVCSDENANEVESTDAKKTSANDKEPLSPEENAVPGDVEGMTDSQEPPFTNSNENQQVQLRSRKSLPLR